MGFLRKWIRFRETIEGENEQGEGCDGAAASAQMPFSWYALVVKRDDILRTLKAREADLRYAA